MFDEAKIVDARKFVGKCKATVQRSGRLGFTETAQDEMGLERGARLLVSDIGEGNLAVVVLPPNQADDRGFEIKRSGIYFSVNMKAFFDQQGVRYRDSLIRTIYDIVRLDECYQGLPVFKFTKRERKRAIDMQDDD